MATSIFQLVGSIMVDNTAANESIAKTEKKTESLGTSLANGAKKAGKFAAGVATAAAGAVAGLTAMATSSAESMDVIDKASQRMGVTAETYQELAHAAELSGVEMSTMEKAAKALEGTDLNFDDAIAQIYSLETAEERSAAAAELFGESVAYKLSPMLNASGEEFAAMTQEAHDLGLVFSGETVTAGAQLNDAMTNVKESIGALATGLGASLMPIVTEFCKFITDNLPTIKGLFDKLAPVLVNLFEKLMPHIVNLVDAILPVLCDLFDILLPVFSDICEAILPIIVELLEEVMPIFIQLAQTILPIIADILEALLPILKPILELLAPILQLILELITPLLKLIDLILPPIIELISTLVGWFAGALKAAIEGIVTVVGKVKDAFQNVKDFLPKLRDTFKDVFEKIVEFVRKPTNAVIGFINGLISGVVSGINTIVKAMNSLHFDVPDWVPGLGGKSFGFDLKELTAPQIPLLAEGAVIEPNKPFAAVLGDQRNGTNIEAPLDTIKQAVLETLNEDFLDGIEVAMRNALQSFDIKWNDRNLGRLVNAYAR